MEPAQDEFLFMGSPVKAFGMPHYDSKLAAAISVLYYESNDKFIIKISPKDTFQEIVLAMGFNTAGSLDKALVSIDDYIGKEALQKGNKAQFDLSEGEQLLIPVIRFNLLKDFKEYATALFTVGNKLHKLKELTQRTAFLLDEEGAKVESEATVKLDYVAAPLKKKRKVLVFDKPFIIMLRKKGISHPYLMVKVMNTELMVKQELE
jgi:serine protease inhibitor